MLLMSLIKSTFVISLLFSPGHVSQFHCVVSSLQILSKDGGPPASSDCFWKRETGCNSELFMFDGVFSFRFKGRCTVRDKPWEIQEKILFHHAFRLFNAHVHPLKDIALHRHTVHTCTPHMCSLLVGNDQIDLHTKTKRSGSGNPTPIPCNRTDLAIRPLPSGRGIIWLMALIITALLPILHWLCMCVCVCVCV